MVRLVADIWNRVIRRLIRDRLFAPEADFWLMPPFAQIDQIMSTNKWKDGGCLMLSDLYPDNKCITYQEAVTDFGLGSGQFLQYAKIAATARHLWPSFPEAPGHTQTLVTMITMAGGRKFVTHLYRALREDKKTGPLKIEDKWQRVCPQEITPRDWEKIHESVRKVSVCNRFKQIQYNMIHMTYLTPRRLHTIDSARDPHCPRCRSAQADFPHMVWTCPTIQRYWMTVLEDLTRITGWTIALDPRACLLGLILRDPKRKTSRRFLVLGLVIAKRRIAIHWLTQQGPLVAKWRTDLREWALAEERHMRNTRRDDKLPEVLLAWGMMIQEITGRSSHSTQESLELTPQQGGWPPAHRVETQGDPA